MPNVKLTTLCDSISNAMWPLLSISSDVFRVRVHLFFNWMNNGNLVVALNVYTFQVMLMLNASMNVKLILLVSSQ